ncbi:MAG: acetolactate synthase small subunit [Luteolibacter sp.]|uniref:acetolactate synthase small subunit n=1 Tax=Luteolibacter sp. TaxID=1962973 RepID=UPI0032648022
MPSIVTTDTPIPATVIARGPSHTLSILVNNEPGVLMRICQVFSRRAFNIDSLVVSEGRNANFSRMTIGISGDPQGLSQIIMQVGKLIDVIHCSEHDSEDAVVKELILLKFLADDSQRTQALQIIEHFGGKTVDLTPTSMIALVSGNSTKIDAAISMFSQFEIIETVRTGKVVMARGEQPT